MSYKNNAISSDDPQAIEKLTEKLHKCEELQTLMKKANAHYKKYGTVKGCEGISDEKAENMDMAARSVHYHWEKQPFPTFHITNNGAEIRRLKKRIESLTATQNTEFVGCMFEAGGGQNGCYNFAISHIHLATIGFYIKFFYHNFCCFFLSE